MVLLPDELEKLLPAKVVERAYDDLGSQPAKEISGMAVDLIKTARLLLAPFQLTAAFQDRFQKVVERIRTKVPAERRRQAPAEIVGPSIQQMQYLDEDNPLWEMFEELLTSSVDSEGISKVHPAFVRIIAQLSRDEAVILHRLRSGDFNIIDRLDFSAKEKRFENLVVEESSIPATDLWQPTQVGLYYTHLNSLGLVEWPVHKQIPLDDSEGVQIGLRRFSTIRLTEFGRLFVSACIPQGEFRNT